MATAASINWMVASRTKSAFCDHTAGPTDTMLISHHQDQAAFEDFGIGLAADEGAQAIENMHGADGGDRKLDRAEESRELDQPDRAQGRTMPPMAKMNCERQTSSRP